MSEEPRGSPLHDDYRELVHDASDRGLVPDGGRTPREIEEDLKRIDELPDHEVEALRDVVERCVYGSERDDRKVGVGLCARLVAAIRLFPIVRRETDAEKDGSRRQAPDWVVGVAVLVLLCGLVFAAARGATGGAGSAPVQNRSRTWGTDAEFSALEAAEGGWSSAPANPTYSDVYMPSHTPSTGAEYKAGFDTDTGNDHRFHGFEDPSDPPLEHHHRLSVFTRVDAQFRFLRLEQPLRRIFPRNDPGDGTRYRIDYRTAVTTDKPFPVPTPTPGAVLLDWSVQPDRWGQSLNRGPGDSLWMQSHTTGLHRVEMRFRSPDDYHLAPLPETPTADLRLTPMALPANVRRSADVVIGHIGKIPGPTYRATVRRLHAYFNGFTVAPMRPEEHRANDYLTVALARKGVCRHRAQTFVVTANAAGIPARLVTNEIHAFAEVQLPDGGWRMLEFRLSGRDWRPALPPQPVDVQAIVLRTIGLLGLVVAIVLLGAAHRRDGSEHRIDLGRRRSRAHRRAERDRQLARGQAAVTRLLNLVRYRLASRLGVSPDDRDVIYARLEAEAPTVVRHWSTLTEVYRGGSAQSDSGRYNLSDAYWAAKALLVWSREGE